MRKLVVTLIAFVVSAGVSHASMTVQQLLTSAEFDRDFQAHLSERGYTGERFDLTLTHHRALFRDPRIAAGIEEYVSSVRADDLFRDRDRAMTAIMLYHAQRSAIGRGWITPEGRRFLAQIDLAALRSMSVRDCNRLLTGKMDPESMLGHIDAYIQSQPPAVLERFLEVESVATRIGFAPDAQPRPLTDDERALIDPALVPVMKRMVADQKRSAAIIRAWELGTIQTGRHACAFRQIALASALSIDPPARDIAIRFLMSMTQ